MENKNDMFNKTPKSGKPKMFRFNLYWMYGLIFIMLVALYMTNDSSGTKELGWTEFQKLAQENVFDKMTVYNKKNLVEATVKNGKTEQVFGNMDVSKIGVSPKVYVKIPSADKFSDFYDKAVADSHIDTQVRFEEGDDAIWNFLVSFGPIILLIGVWMFLMRRMSGGTGAANLPAQPDQDHLLHRADSPDHSSHGYQHHFDRRAARFGRSGYRYGPERHIAEFRRWRDDPAAQALPHRRLHLGPGTVGYRAGDHALLDQDHHSRQADHLYPEQLDRYRDHQQLFHLRNTSRGVGDRHLLRRRFRNGTGGYPGTAVQRRTGASGSGACGIYRCPGR